MLQDPIKNKKADRWDALVSQGMDPDSATAQVEREFMRGAPSDAVVNRGGGAPEGYAKQYAKGLARQGAQGLTAGWADEGEAGVRSLFGGGEYKDIRDDIRTQNDQFARENPVASFGANVVGGLVMGGGAMAAAKQSPKLASLLQTLGQTPKASATMTAGQRIGQAAKLGAGGGAFAGSGTAREAGDVPLSMVVGGVAGGLLGTAVGGVTEGVKAGRNLLAGVGQQPGQVGPVRRFLQTESPEQAGARRVLGTLGRTDMTLDQLEAASRTADAPTALAELVPDNQGVRGLRIGRNVGRRRDAIDRSLAERMADEPARYAEAISKASGVREGMDAKVVGEKALASVEDRANDLWRQAYTRPDVSAKPILGVLEKAARMRSGRMALDRAAELSNSFDALQHIDPANPTISVENLHYLRQGYDYAIHEAEHDGDAQMVRILMDQRSAVDRLFKRAGGKLAQRADRLWEGASAKGESFAAGQRSQQAKTKQAMVRAKTEARDPEAFRQGAASKQLEAVEMKQDGGAGQMRNPTVETVGSPTRRARARMGYENAGQFQNVRDAAEKIVGRIGTRQAVSGNSTTAGNLSEIADEFMTDPSALLQAPVNPTGALKLLAERIARGSLQGINAAQATEMGNLFAAGLPGQMSREQAIATLRKMAPQIEEMYRRQLMRSGAVTRAGFLGAGGSGR